jgi:hypothetical protein
VRHRHELLAAERAAAILRPSETAAPSIVAIVQMFDARRAAAARRAPRGRRTAD